MPIFYSTKTSKVIVDISITKTCVKVVEHIYIANHSMSEGVDSDRISGIPVLSVSDLNKIENEHRCKFNVQIDPDTVEKFIMQSLPKADTISFKGTTFCPVCPTNNKQICRKSFSLGPSFTMT